MAITKGFFTVIPEIVGRADSKKSLGGGKSNQDNMDETDENRCYQVYATRYLQPRRRHSMGWHDSEGTTRGAMAGIVRPAPW